MKNSIQLLVLALAFVFFAACQGGASSETNEKETEEVTEETSPETSNEAEEVSNEFKLDLENSIVNWEANKKFVESGHNGTLNFKSGQFVVNEGQLVGAVFVVDMTSIKNKDMEGTDGAEKLEGHLRSDDFFSVEQFPEASFKLSSVSENESVEYSHTATGELTIKGITNEVSFPLNLSVNQDQLDASGELTFDRTKYDVKYGSDAFFDVVKDKVIKNDVKLTFKVKGSAV